MMSRMRTCPRNSRSGPGAARPYLREVSLKSNKPVPSVEYPFSIPAVRNLGTLTFSPDVTFLVGENGTGKSTLLEAIAIAIALGMNPEGGSRNFNFGTRASHSSLWQYLRLVRSWSRPRDQYFLRAESFFNVATQIEMLDQGGGGDRIIEAYGGQSLHDQSHWESFFALFMNRFRGNGLYLLDEPEAALSPMRQLQMLRRMRELVLQESQFIIATHSSMLLAYPNAFILVLNAEGYRNTAYIDIEHYRVTKAFLEDPEEGVRRVFTDWTHKCFRVSNSGETSPYAVRMIPVHSLLTGKQEAEIGLLLWSLGFQKSGNLPQILLALPKNPSTHLEDTNSMSGYGREMYDKGKCVQLLPMCPGQSR